jgi:cysteine desulfurase
MIYLDYNATSPLMPNVRAAMDAVAGVPLNAASIHSAGRHAKKLLEDARVSIANAFGAFPNEVLFTASGSEANNMVLRGFAGERPLLVAASEHASILKTANLLGASMLPVDAQGLLRLDILEQQLMHLAQPALVSIMLANNETGVIQPIAAIARIVHANGALLHVDAVQALGKTPIDWGLLGADMITLCAHKCGGPVGVGVLLMRNDMPVTPLITGGGQELGRRAGTENIPAIVGFAQLVREVANCPQAAEWLAWRTELEKKLLEAAPGAVVFGAGGEPLPSGEAELLNEQREFRNSGEGTVQPDSACPHPDFSPNAKGVWVNPTSPVGRGGSGASARLPQTLCISMPGVKSETQLMNFDLAGFAVSAGSACSSGRVNASHVLLSMGVAPQIAETAIRISWGWATTKAELDAFAEAWVALYGRLGK